MSSGGDAGSIHNPKNLNQMNRKFQPNFAPKQEPKIPATTILGAVGRLQIHDTSIEH